MILIGTAFGVYFYFESRYALAEELEKTKSRLEYKIKTDQAQSIRDRMWKLDDRYQNKPMPSEVKEEKRKLSDDYNRLNVILNEMEKKGIEVR